jgi:hypothetical protein
MAGVPDVLQRILARKAEEIAERRRRRTLADLEAELENGGNLRGFTAAMMSRVAAGGPAVIAEVKRASPSKGVIREQSSEPAQIARRSTRRAVPPACPCSRIGIFFRVDERFLRRGARRPAPCRCCARTSPSTPTRWPRRAGSAPTRSC